MFNTFVFRYVSLADSEVNETWLWTKAPFYFIQPPSVFQYTSLLFNFHTISGQTTELCVYLPAACHSPIALSCYDVIHSTKNTTNASLINNKYLDVLTNEVRLTSLVHRQIFAYHA